MKITYTKSIGKDNYRLNKKPMNNIGKTNFNMANFKRNKVKTLEAIELTKYTIINQDEFILLDYLMDDEDIVENSSNNHICQYQVFMPIRDIKRLYEIVKDL